MSETLQCKWENQLLDTAVAHVFGKCRSHFTHDLLEWTQEFVSSENNRYQFLKILCHHLTNGKFVSEHGIAFTTRALGQIARADKDDSFHHRIRESIPYGAWHRILVSDFILSDPACLLCLPTSFFSDNTASFLDLVLRRLEGSPYCAPTLGHVYAFWAHEHACITGLLEKRIIQLLESKDREPWICRFLSAFLRHTKLNGHIWSQQLVLAAINCIASAPLPWLPSLTRHTPTMTHLLLQSEEQSVVISNLTDPCSMYSPCNGMIIERPTSATFLNEQLGTKILEQVASIFASKLEQSVRSSLIASSTVTCTSAPLKDNCLSQDTSVRALHLLLFLQEFTSIIRSTFPFSEYLFSDDHKELIKESLWNLCSCILLSRNEGELPDSVPSSIADFLSEVCKPHDIPHNKSQLYQCIAGAARLLWETTLPPHHLQNCVQALLLSNQSVRPQPSPSFHTICQMLWIQALSADADQRFSMVFLRNTVACQHLKPPVVAIFQLMNSSKNTSALKWHRLLAYALQHRHCCFMLDQLILEQITVQMKTCDNPNDEEVCQSAWHIANCIVKKVYETGLDHFAPFVTTSITQWIQIAFDVVFRTPSERLTVSVLSLLNSIMKHASVLPCDTDMNSTDMHIMTVSCIFDSPSWKGCNSTHIEELDILCVVLDRGTLIEKQPSSIFVELTVQFDTIILQHCCHLKHDVISRLQNAIDHDDLELQRRAYEIILYIGACIRRAALLDEKINSNHLLSSLDNVWRHFLSGLSSTSKSVSTLASVTCYALLFCMSQQCLSRMQTEELLVEGSSCTEIGREDPIQAGSSWHDMSVSQQSPFANHKPATDTIETFLENLELPLWMNACVIIASAQGWTSLWCGCLLDDDVFQAFADTIQHCWKSHISNDVLFRFTGVMTNTRIATDKEPTTNCTSSLLDVARKVVNAFLHPLSERALCVYEELIAVEKGHILEDMHLDCA